MSESDGVKQRPKVSVKDFSALFVMLGNNVRKQRRARGLSQSGLAKLADLHRAYVADVERGARNISVGSVITLPTDRPNSAQAAIRSISLRELMMIVSASAWLRNDSAEASR